MNDAPVLLQEPFDRGRSTRSERFAQLNAIRVRVQGFVHLPKNWAGDDTIPPSPAVADHVDRLLRELPEDAVVPYATASGEGEIMLTWFHGEDRLTATASPEGHLLWVSKVAGQFHDGEVLPLDSASFAPLFPGTRPLPARMSGDPPPCPCEHHAPPGSPGPVADAETVIRYIPVSQWIMPSGLVSASAFPRDELRGVQGKSVSVLRRDLTAPEEIARRGVALSKEPAWAGDPVLAQTRVLTVRGIADKQGRRELCVNADPVDTPLGFCATHAGVLRADPPPDLKQLLEWARLREKLADAFGKAAPCSGKPLESSSP